MIFAFKSKWGSRNENHFIYIRSAWSVWEKFAYYFHHLVHVVTANKATAFNYRRQYLNVHIFLYQEALAATLLIFLTSLIWLRVVGCQLLRNTGTIPHMQLAVHASRARCITSSPLHCRLLSDLRNANYTGAYAGPSRGTRPRLRRVLCQSLANFIGCIIESDVP
jgi:hypothetical protein